MSGAQNFLTTEQVQALAATGAPSSAASKLVKDDIEDSDLPRFSLPSLVDSPAGWGPSGGVKELEKVPFQPFNKTDRLGRISDWNSNQFYRSGRYTQQFATPASGALFDYKAPTHDDFITVDNKPAQKPKWPRRPFRKQWTNRRGRGRGRGRWNNNRRGRGGRGGRNDRWGQGRYNPWHQADPKEQSVHLSEEWPELQTFQFAELSKQAAYLAGEPEDLVWCGALQEYKSKFDVVSPNTKRTLNRYERQFYTTTTSVDPVIQELVKAGKGNVFATDTLLAFVATAPKSVDGWDVLITKRDGLIFFDKRPSSRIDFLTVNENWNEVLIKEEDSPNHPRNLGIEATVINHNFSQQVLTTKDPIEYKRPNPFADPESSVAPAAVAYRYRSFPIDTDTTVVCRTELNGYRKHKRTGETIRLTVRALNEFDNKLQGGVSYRQKLGSQLGAVVATEMKNNTVKLQRWTVETLLSGADQLELGFVSRVHPKDPRNHDILKVTSQKPPQFAKNLGVKERNVWGILLHIISSVRAQKDGKFLLMKDANKTELRLYQLPDDFVDAHAPEED